MQTPKCMCKFDAFFLYQIIPFSHEILGNSKPHIVEWNEADYEEYLVERVKRRNDNFAIGLAIDLSPTIRRVRRIRHLLEKVKTTFTVFVCLFRNLKSNSDFL